MRNVTKKQKNIVNLNVLIIQFIITCIILCVGVYIFIIRYHEKEILKDQNNTIQYLKSQNLEYEIKIDVLSGQISELEKSDINNVLLESIVNDMLSLAYISQREKAQIYDSIMVYSSQYDINPAILYAVLFTESSLKPYLEHPETYIPNLNKKVKAVGLGGIVWEYWGPKLKEAQIAETRQDLFNIDVNIAASAFVLNELRGLSKLSNARTINESMLMRYYGSQYAKYEKKIYNKIALLLSDQF